MKRVIVLLLLLLSAVLLAQTAYDMAEHSVVFRLVGKWKAHLHFEYTPPEIPKDYFGTVEAKQALGMRVEAFVHIEPIAGGRPMEARGIFGADEDVLATGKVIQEVNSVLFLQGTRGYLPMNGALKDGKLVLQGDRTPKDPNGGTWRVSVEFKGDDEIDIWLLDAGNEKQGFIKLTREKD